MSLQQIIEPFVYFFGFIALLTFACVDEFDMQLLILSSFIIQIFLVVAWCVKFGI